MPNYQEEDIMMIQNSLKLLEEISLVEQKIWDIINTYVLIVVKK